MTGDCEWTQNIEATSTEELVEDIQEDFEDILANLEDFGIPSHDRQDESPYRAARDQAKALNFKEVEKTVDNWNLPVGTTVFQGQSGLLVLDQRLNSDSVRIRYSDKATALREKQDNNILVYPIDGPYGKKNSGSNEVTADRMALEGVELDETAENALEARAYISHVYDKDRDLNEKIEANKDFLAELDDSFAPNI